MGNGTYTGYFLAKNGENAGFVNIMDLQNGKNGTNMGYFSAKNRKILDFLDLFAIFGTFSQNPLQNLIAFWQ